MTRRASKAGIDAIRQAMKLSGWTQTEVANEVRFSRSTLNQILGGQAVKLENLEELCHLFDLQVGQVLEIENPTDLSHLNSLVQTIRDRIRPIIQEKCGTMRVLDMSQPIELGEIYTHVNILEKITGRTRRELPELMQEVSPENFERFSLGAVKEQRLPGLKVVENHRKLMILGKPGAGKTTFLKHLAMQCIGGNFQSDRVPLFITLKEFAETNGQPDLLTFIDRLVNPTHPVGALHAIPLHIETPTHQILENGHALILLDGLDEVRETDASRVLRQIQQFSERYSRNTFVITCRIAAREYTFQQFTEVEVADFDDKQIAEVSGKWFRYKQDQVKAERFLQQLKDNPPIRDLASSPLLLTLLCLVFEDSGDFPANRAELYQTGVDVLLKKWDTKRNIERDQIYKKLSLKRKEDLLSQIAWRTFEAGNYFFKQKDVEQQIREFIENLPGASTDEETLNLDSEAVLKSIEAQHGLFVERAYRIYSFSHLTFHEYFAAREAKEKSQFTQLTQHLTDKRWREVILLTVGMVPTADQLLRQMKQATDELARDGKLQQFLQWVDEKARSVQPLYKLTAIRAFYFAFDHNHYLTHDLDLELELALNNDRDCELSLDLAIARDLAFTLDLDLDFTFALNKLIGIASRIDLDLKVKLEELSSQLPNPQASYDFQNQWWREHGQAWVDQLRTVIIQYRSIGHDWQLSYIQEEIVQKYRYANQLLVDCLNSDCYVSREVRQEIEDTLLLPIAEIEKRRKNE